MTFLHPQVKIPKEGKAIYRILVQADQRYLDRFQRCCWRRLEKISWTDRVRREEVLLRVKKERNKVQKNNPQVG
jgi:hypothetical protein